VFSTARSSRSRRICQPPALVWCPSWVLSHRVEFLLLPWPLSCPLSQAPDFSRFLRSSLVLFLLLVNFRSLPLLYTAFPSPSMLITLFLAPLLATLSFARSHPSRSWHPPRSFSPGFPYGSQRVRGVSLGGWLVLEVCCYLSPPFLVVCSRFYHHRRLAVDNTELVRRHGKSSHY
jgi:hypothetical protein